MQSIKKILLWLWPRLKSLNVVIVCVALLISAISHQPFSNALAYAFFNTIIGAALVTAGQHGLSFLLRRRFPERLDLQDNWPGWPLMMPLICVSVIVSAYTGGPLTKWLIRLDPVAPGTNMSSVSSIRLYGIALALSLVLAGSYFLYSRARMARMEANTQAALRTAAENQLKLLESQLEPHMLFNTLANLRVLIALDSHRAQAMLDQLIAFMRATLDASRAGSHSLSCEFARIGEYLALMQVRMDARLESRLHLPAGLAMLTIPPLLLQPLVENAIKHGLEPQINGGRIEVLARRDGAMLVLSVRDTGVGLSMQHDNDGSHFGLHQVRERIAILHGHAATLTLANAADEEGGTIAILRLPIVTSTIPMTH